MAKSALITGITGQDGSYLCELLLAKGYEVHGMIRRSSSFNTARIEPFYKDPHRKDARMFLHYGDLTDGTSLSHLVKEIMPDEVYNLAAQSHVRVSFDIPVYTVQVDAVGTLHLLEALRSAGNGARFYQASSSEMYGKVAETPQTEKTPFHPRSPYACAKVFSYWQTVNYREAYGMFACNGILFNHESPRRGETFVTRKITRAATPHQGRAAGEALPRQSGRQARLGLRRRLRRGDVADAAAGASRTITSSRPAKPDRCASLSKRSSACWIWIGRSMSKSTRAIFAPPRSICCWATPPRPPSKLGWTPKVGFQGACQDDGR